MRPLNQLLLNALARQLGTSEVQTCRMGLLPLRQLLPDPQHPIGPPFLLGLRIGMLVGHAGLRALKGGLLLTMPQLVLSGQP